MCGLALQTALNPSAGFHYLSQPWEKLNWSLQFVVYQTQQVFDVNL